MRRRAAACSDTLPLFRRRRDNNSGPMGGRGGEITRNGGLTPKAVGVGLLVGSLLCFSNMYFGLQSGWVTMGSLQSAILGCGILRAVQAFCASNLSFSVEENVVLQTAAVATATMPLAAGLVGVIPAMSCLTTVDGAPESGVTFTPTQLLLWTASLAFLGLFTAPPLRRQVIVEEKLPFPSGAATASVIRVLHAPAASGEKRVHSDAATGGGLRHMPRATRHSDVGDGSGPTLRGTTTSSGGATSSGKAAGSDGEGGRDMWMPLGVSFGGSFAYHVVAWVWEGVRSADVLAALGWRAPGRWEWVVQPSMGYVGQGILMGPRVALSMLGGAVTGWAMLGPMARRLGWAPGPIDDWEQGATGWLLWVSMAVMLADTVASLAFFIARKALHRLCPTAPPSPSPAPPCPCAELQMGAFRHLRPTGSSGAPGDPEIWGQDGESGGARVGGTPGGLYPEAGDPEDGSERRRLLTNVVAYPKGGGARGGQDGGDRVGCHGEGDGCDAAEMDVENGVLEPRDDRGGEGGGWRPVEDRVGAGVGVREECQRDGAERRGGGEKRALASSQMYECGSDVLIERGRRDAEISIRLWAPGLAASTILCVCVINGMLGLPLHQPLLAVLLGIPVSVLAVRALGETDLNPVSAVAKVLQLVFAAVAPGNTVANLSAGAIAEAGALQAGDMMQDFKTAHVLGVSPREQFWAMLIGASSSVFVSVAAFLLYARQGPIPNAAFPAPTAAIWLDMARLVNGGRLPTNVWPFCVVLGALAVVGQVFISVATLARQRGARHDSMVGPSRLLDLMPSAVAFAVGMYLPPKWTLPRVVGGLIEMARAMGRLKCRKQTLVVIASGFVLGEGLASIVGVGFGL